MKLYLHSYSRTSKSAKSLAKALGATFIWSGEAHKLLSDPNEKTIVINWGSSANNFTSSDLLWINSPINTNVATSKIQTYEILKENNIPTCEFTKNRGEALNWLYNLSSVYTRYKNRSSGGKGILYHSPNQIDEFLQQTPALFYTKEITIADEYRVHIFEQKNTHNFFVQKKIKKENWVANYGHIPYSSHISSHDNGYIFVSTTFDQNSPAYDNLKDTCIKALKALKLNFGAFDVKYSRENGQGVILECNTAPGLFPKTLNFYQDSISTYVHNA